MGIKLGGNDNAGGLNLGGSPNPIGSAPAGLPTGGGLQLTKGAKLDLTKGNPGLDALVIGLGWDTASGGQSFDLDAEVFMLGSSGQVVSPDHIVFYNKAVSPDGAVRHNGDNLTGQGEGDDETVDVKLSQISPDVQKLIFTVTIDQALAKRQNFGQVSNAYIRVINKSSNQELCRFDLTEDHSASISMIVAEAYRHNGEWKFGALEIGSTNDLSGLCLQYGAM